MSVEVWQATPPPRSYRFELLPEEAMASALELLEQPHGEDVSDELDGAVDRGLERAMAFATRQARERQAALVLLNELIALQAPERRLRVERHRPRFRSAELCRLLIDKGLDEAHRDATRGREFTDLAVLAAEQTDGEVPEAIRQDFLAEAFSAAANVRRLEGDRAAAAESLRRAEKHLAAGSGTLMVRAELLLEKAALAGDHGEITAGLGYVDQALCILRAGARDRVVARALAVKGRLELMAGRPTTALPLFEEARRLLGESPDRALQLAVHQHLAVCLGEVGRFGEARLALRVAHGAAKLLARPVARCRLLLIEGRLAHRAGAAGAAEEALREALHGFRQHGLQKTAALVGLELCRSDLKRRRFARLARDSRFIVPLAGEWLAGSLARPSIEVRLRGAVLDRSW